LNNSAPHPPLILASASPRRSELLASLGAAFEVIPSRAEERHDPAMPAPELCRLNAALKAGDVARSHPSRVVLGADTLVWLEGELFGKPRDLAEARAMLARLSGRTHQVTTGVCLVAGARREIFSDTTAVTFKWLGGAVIEDYLARVPVLDKAGAYAIQEHGAMIVERHAGSLSNVIGLPLEKLRAVLRAWKLLE